MGVLADLGICDLGSVSKKGGRKRSEERGEERRGERGTSG